MEHCFREAGAKAAELQEQQLVNVTRIESVRIMEREVAGK